MTAAPYFTPEGVQDLKAAFLAGEPMTRLAALHECSVATVSRAIRAKGTYADLDGLRGGFAGDGRLEGEIRNLHGAGLPIKAIAGRLGISRARLRRLCPDLARAKPGPKPKRKEA